MKEDKQCCHRIRPKRPMPGAKARATVDLSDKRIYIRSNR